MGNLVCCAETRHNEVEEFLIETFESMKFCTINYKSVKKTLEHFSGITIGNKNSLKVLNLTNLIGEEDRNDDINEVGYMTVVNTFIESDNISNIFAAYHKRYFNLLFKICQNYENKYIILLAIFSLISDVHVKSNDRLENFVDLLSDKHFQKSISLASLTDLMQDYLNFNLLFISYIAYEVSKKDTKVSQLKRDIIKKNIESHCTEQNIKSFFNEHIVNALNLKYKALDLKPNIKLNYQELMKLVSCIRDYLSYPYLLNKFLSIYDNGDDKKV